MLKGDTEIQVIVVLVCSLDVGSCPSAITKLPNFGIEGKEIHAESK